MILDAIQRLRREVRALFPPGVVGFELTDFHQAVPLVGQELFAVAGAVEKRVNEFAAGRACARRALEELGYVGVTLSRQADGQPTWPAGVIGSISHCAGYCAAVVARCGDFEGLGIDVEVRRTISSDLWTQVATRAERKRLRELETERAADLAVLLFSAKEALFKAQYPRSRALIDFQDVDVSVGGDDQLELRLAREISGLGAAGTTFAGRYSFSKDHVFTAVTLERRVKSDSCVQSLC